MDANFNQNQKLTMKKTKQQPRIQLRFNNYSCRETCAITGQEVEPNVPLAFFLNDDSGKPTGKPVLPEVALKEGFTMSREDFDKINKLDSTEQQADGLEAYATVPLVLKLALRCDTKTPYDLPF